MVAKKKKKNVQDATLKNIRVLKRRIERLENIIWTAASIAHLDTMLDNPPKSVTQTMRNFFSALKEVK